MLGERNGEKKRRKWLIKGFCFLFGCFIEKGLKLKYRIVL